MATLESRDMQDKATIQHVFLTIALCVLIAVGMAGCATAPVPEEAPVTEPERVPTTEPEKVPMTEPESVPVTEPEKHVPEPKELAAKATTVTEFTELVYGGGTVERAKIGRDKIEITVAPQSPKAAREEARASYAAYCRTKSGQLIAGLPNSRIPENLPPHIKPPYSQRFKRKYDLSPSVLWCQDKEDVHFGIEMRDRTKDVERPELTVTVYTESFVEKNRVWTSERDMISRIEKEIEKDKQEILYSLGIIDIPTVTLIAKVPRLDAEGHQHLDLSIQNRGSTRMQVRTDTEKKFVARDGNSYAILWEVNKEGESIKATSSGEGCLLTDKNSLFVVNPGSKCVLSMPVAVPGLNQQSLDGVITFDLFSFDMRRISAYEDKTSPATQSLR